MDKLQAFHQSRKGYLTFGLIELVLVYVFASIAIDTANMFVYALTIILFVGACINFVKFDEVKRKARKKAKIGK